MKKLFFGLTAVVLVIAGCAGEPEDGQYAQVAQCLTDKGVKFYGAFWCPHCSDQKRMFGDDIRYITYVECDPRGENADPAACRAAGVTRYPTWGFPGQDNLLGAQQPEALAKKANCDDFLQGGSASGDVEVAPAETSTSSPEDNPPETEDDDTETADTTE